MKRIHIVGCGPRSGTTLLCEMMIACFKIDLYGKHENSIYTGPWRHANLFLTKKPMDILTAESVLKVMPNLYIIYMLRDPRDMIVSKHGLDPSRYWSSLTYWKTYTPFAQTLESHPRFMTVRYEDLVSQPDDIQAELMTRMPFLMKRAAFSHYHKVAQPTEAALQALKGVRAVSSSSIGRWRDHLPRVAGQLQIHGSITDDLIRYGYEQDADWEHVLEGIEPDVSESYHPEHFLEKRFKATQQRKRRKAFKVALSHHPWAVSLRPAYKKLKRFFGLNRKP